MLESLENLALSLNEQVSRDLSAALCEYKDEKIGIRLLASRMHIHEKTLKRLLLKEHTPGYQTLYKLYRVLSNSKNDSELLEKVSPIVKAALERGNPKVMSKEIIFHSDLEDELVRDRCFSEIYFMAGCGPLSKEYIGFRFGEHGLETMRRMLKLEVLDVQKDGSLVIGKNQINMSASTIKLMGLQLIDRFLRPEMTDDNGENFEGIYAEGLSEEAYNEWLKIDEEAYRKKIELCRKKENRGKIKAFTFMATDKLNPGIKK